MLRIEDLGLAGREPEEAGVPALDVVENGTRLDVARVRELPGVDPCCEELLVGEAGDGLPPLAEVLPERVHVGGPWEAAGHAADRDLVSLVSRVRRLLGHRVVCSRRACRRRLSSLRLAPRSLLGSGPTAGRGVFHHETAQRLDGRTLEERGHRDLDVELGADLRDELDGEQRMAAELEEVVVDADLLDAEKALPDRRHLLLGRGRRRDVGVAEVGPRVASHRLLATPPPSRAGAGP